MDITITGVPEGAEDNVRQLAMTAIERFIKARDLNLDEAVKAKYEKDTDIIRVANGLSEKFAVEIEEEEDIEAIVKEPVVLTK